MAETSSSPSGISRRRFIKIAAISAGVLAGGGLLGYFLSSRSKTVTVRDRRLLMGTVVDLTLIAESEGQGRSAIAATYAEMQRLMGFFDYRSPASELARLNRDGRLEQASPELIEVLAQARHFSEISGGAFDVTVQPILDAYQSGQAPTSRELGLVDYRNLQVEGSTVAYRLPGMRVTLDAIAKGRVIDGGAAALRAQGFSDLVVEAGGDLVAGGAHPDGSFWRIGVANPRPADGKQWLATLSVSDRAVATSGDYLDTFTSDFSLNHIIDPHSGLSPQELCSATVIAPTLTEADALATTLMVLGVRDGLALVESLPSVEALLATKELKLYRSSGFPAA